MKSCWSKWSQNEACMATNDRNTAVSQETFEKQ